MFAKIDCVHGKGDRMARMWRVPCVWFQVYSYFESRGCDREGWNEAKAKTWDSKTICSSYWIITNYMPMYIAKEKSTINRTQAFWNTHTKSPSAGGVSSACNTSSSGIWWARYSLLRFLTKAKSLLLLCCRIPVTQLGEIRFLFQCQISLFDPRIWASCHFHWAPCTGALPKLCRSSLVPRLTKR